MYTNDLHNAYEYERERRNDERRAAAESRRVHEPGSKRKSRIPSPVIVTVILTVLTVLLRIL
jgi:hypothetical protein